MFGFMSDLLSICRVFLFSAILIWSFQLDWKLSLMILVYWIAKQE